MAVLWSKTKAGVHYEVRSAGQSRRLYTDGVFHSQWNPNQPVSSTVWDLLLLSAFFVRDLSQLKHALILGVGGGAIIKKLQHFFEQVEITGVDMDDVHLHVAKKHFGCGHQHVQLIQSEAKSWLHQLPGRENTCSTVDLLVEDLFMPGQEEGEPLRAIAASEEWLCDLLGKTREGGVLAMNFESEQQARQAQLGKKSKGCGVGAIYLLQTEGYDNAIAVLCKHDLSRSDFAKRLRQMSEMQSYKQIRHLKHSIKSVRV